MHHRPCPADASAGKPTEWPELVGQDAEHAKEVIAAFGYNVFLVPEVRRSDVGLIKHQTLLRTHSQPWVGHRQHLHVGLADWVTGLGNSRMRAI